jgi:hypothetical protein
MKQKFKERTINRLENLGQKTQLKFIELSIKGMSNEKLDELSGLVMSYPNDETKTIIILLLEHEYKKRNIKQIFFKDGNMLK